MDKNEEKMVVIDFRHVECEVNIGEFTEMDLSKEVGNAVHRRAADIGLDDKARELYHNGIIECDKVTAVMMRKIIEESEFVWFVKQGVFNKIDMAIKD